jgi:hypothetical protein
MVSIPEMEIKSPQEDCTEGTGIWRYFHYLGRIAIVRRNSGDGDKFQ